MNIATRISLLAVILVLITAGSITLLSWQQGKAGAEARLRQSVKAEVAAKAAGIRVQIDNLRNDILFLSRLPPITGIMRTRRTGGVDPESGDSEHVWRQRLASIFTSFLHTKPEYLKVRYIGIADRGREIVRVNNFGALPKVVAVDDLQRKGQRPYFQKAILLKPGEVFLSGVNLDQEHGRVMIPHRPVLRAATPVFDVDGQVFGIAIVSMDMRQMLKDISEEDFKGDNDFLLNATGDILTGPDPSQAFGFDFGKRHRIQQIYSSTAALFAAGGAAHGFIDIGVPGKNAYFSRVNFYPRDSSRFFVLLDVHGAGPEAEMLISNLRTNMRLYVLFIAIGIILAILLARQLVRPFIALSVVAQKIGEGARDVDLPRPGAGEVGMLTMAFASMLQKIDSREKALKEKVVELECAQRLATTDGLTGLFNHGFFNARLQEECQRAERYGLSLSLIMVDIDLFKQVNDSHGHQAGDACLVFLAASITETSREVDTAARYGGEEFVLILPQTSAQDARTLGERLRKKVADAVSKPDRPHFTISAGVASWCAGSDMTPETFVKSADDALYAAKKAGRNRVVLWQAEK